MPIHFLSRMLFGLLLTAFAVVPLLAAEDWSSLKLTEEEVAKEKEHFIKAFSKATLDRPLQSRKQGQKLGIGRLDGSSQRLGGPSDTELAALDYFRKEAGYFEVNAYLRGAKMANYPPRSVLALARLVASALNKLPKAAQVLENVYRGTHLPLKLLTTKYKAGKVVTEPAFTSCCADRSIAAIYARGAKHVEKQQVLFVIRSATGKRVSAGLAGEILFQPGTSFKVLRHETDEWGQLKIFLAEVATSQ